LLVSVFEEFIAGHPFVRADPTLRRLADQVVDQMADFYQDVGAASLRTEDRTA
jgi:hypothetical protein